MQKRVDLLVDEGRKRVLDPIKILEKIIVKGEEAAGESYILTPGKNHLYQN